MNYPAMTTGLVCVPRGVGSLTAHVHRRSADYPGRQPDDHSVRFSADRGSMWQMSQFSLRWAGPIIISGFLQGFGLGCTQGP